MSTHNVRVYGLLVNENNQVLLSDEQEYGMRFTKFPGGGLEYGEGLIDGLKREYMEECGIDIDVLGHFYTTDFFVKSAFNNTQIISVYYLVKNLQPLPFKVTAKRFDFEEVPLTTTKQIFRWAAVKDIKDDELTFPIDKHVAQLLKQTL